MPSKRNGVPTCSREYPPSIRKSSYLRSHLTTFPILPRTIISLGPLRFPPPPLDRFETRQSGNHLTFQYMGRSMFTAGSTFTAPLGSANLTASRPLLSSSSNRAAVLYISLTAVLLCQTLIDAFKQHYCLRFMVMRFCRRRC